MVAGIGRERGRQALWDRPTISREVLAVVLSAKKKNCGQQSTENVRLARPRCVLPEPMDGPLVSSRLKFACGSPRTSALGGFTLCPDTAVGSTYP